MDAKPKPSAKPYTDAEIQMMIAVGAVVCQKIKIALPEIKWTDVTGLFTKFKQNMRKFFKDKTELEIFRELQNYSTEHIMDILEAIYPIN